MGKRMPVVDGIIKKARVGHYYCVAWNIVLTVLPVLATPEVARETVSNLRVLD